MSNRDKRQRASRRAAPSGSPFTSRPVNDGPSLRDAVRRALEKWDRSGDTYRFQNDVRFAVAAFDYNTKANKEVDRDE